MSLEYDGEKLKVKAERMKRLIASILIAAVAGEKIKPHQIDTEHSALAIEFLREGENLADKGDVIQASEKLYKAAEEAIKGQARIHARDVHEEAERRGRWNTALLFKAARISLLGKEIRRYWDSAWTLHVEGFHEAKLDIEEVKERLEDIKRLVEKLT